jgi:hypothetical protein
MKINDNIIIWSAFAFMHNKIQNEDDKLEKIPV